MANTENAPPEKPWFSNRATLAGGRGTKHSPAHTNPRVAGNGSVITSAVVEDLIEESFNQLDGGTF